MERPDLAQCDPGADQDAVVLLQQREEESRGLRERRGVAPLSIPAAAASGEMAALYISFVCLIGAMSGT